MTTLHDTLSKLPALYSTDGNTQAETREAVFVFTPDGGADWLVWEYDPTEGLAFGLCDLGMGFPELGTVVMTDTGIGYEPSDIVENIRGGLGLRVEVERTIHTVAGGYAHKSLDLPEYLI